MKKITIARESWFHDYSEYIRHQQSYKTVELYFNSLPYAYHYYAKEGFIVESKLRGARKDYGNDRCIVIFFEVPLEDTRTPTK